MHFNLKRFFSAIMFSLVLALPTIGHANTVEETPSAMAMTGDAIFARPVLLATTIVGAGLFIISSPFSALGGNFGEAFDVLVGGPFETTFVRCLGCTLNGRKASETVEQDEE